MFKINEDGLGIFPELEQLKIKNYATVSRDIWGNMNDYYAKDDSDKVRIYENDIKLAQHLDIKDFFVLQTPPESSLLHLDENSIRLHQYQNPQDENGYRFIGLKANALILEKQVSRIGVVSAPFDSPIVVAVNPDWEGLLYIHLGFPQVYQNIHIDIFRLFKVKYPTIDISKFKLFIFPYICAEHYEMRAEKFNELLKNRSDFNDFVKSKFNETEKKEVFAVDFMKFSLKQLEREFGISQISISGLCTYEEALQGRLFSYQYKKEFEKAAKEQGREDNSESGCFNVGVSI